MGTTNASFETTTVALRPSGPSRRATLLDSERACRALSFLVAALAILVAAPLMLVIAVLVRATSPGPILFAQPRIGLDRRNRGAGGNRRRAIDFGGRPFRIYKFRTMHVAAAPTDEQRWARPDDPRVTAVGRILRKYRLDELPQLFNVLRGDMNIVGPRPEQPGIFADLRGHIDGYEARQRVPPGITGWAQINQHYDRSLEDVKRKLAYDLEYIRRRSPLEDVRIMVRTLPVVIFQRGAW